MRVDFLPGTVGMKSGSVTVDLAELPDITIGLSGEGIQTQLTASPTSLSLGSKDIDDGATSPPAESTITNSGTEPVTVSGVGVTGDFAQATGNASDCVNGKLLAAGDTCKLRVTFDPTATGSAQRQRDRALERA